MQRSVRAALSLLIGPAILLTTLSECGSAQSARPNVVVLLADDAGWGDYSYSGNQQVATPNIDSIAEQGVSLDRFYVCPLCSPTRAEFLTGRYYLRTGVRGVSTGQERLNLDEKTLADAFQQAGYATGAFGKWHNGTQWPYHPMARGFDTYFGHSAGHWGEYFDPPLEDEGRMVRTTGYIVDVCTDRALRFIEEHRNVPFFCYVPFTTPHSPWAAPPKDWKRFQNKELNQRATAADQENLDQTRCALAMLENQDWNVGRILKKLDDLGLQENTIVVYFSDNGPNSHRWNGGMKGKKGQTDEGGVRSVCFIRWPGKLPAGHTVTQVTAAIDLLPTLTALAGIPRIGDKPLDGKDISSLLKGDTTTWPERTIISSWNNRTSARTDRFRMDHKGKLYDMLEDPAQTTPVNDQHPEVVQRLKKEIAQWKRDVQIEKNQPVAYSQGVDPRPIPVGYREFPVTMLPARDGVPRGGIQRSSSAPNCSYFVNWTSTDDAIEWRIEVHTAGTYEATVDYTCPENDIGSTVELTFQDSHLTGKVAPAWDPPLLTNQDTIPRPKAESIMKVFHPLRLGTIELPSGTGTLVLRATEIPGSTVMNLRRLTLTLLPEK